MMRLYAGLFFVALATLMYEVLLTRIFSVTMWYHFAFMAISVAMFGMTFGAVLVYLRRERLVHARQASHLAWASLIFAFTIVLSLLAHLGLPFVLADGDVISGRAWLLCTLLTFVVTLVPFVFSGVAIALALTGSSARVGRLYAADLAGAAVGCVATLGLLSVVDAPTAVFAIACAAAFGAWCFSTGGQTIGLRKAAGGAVVLFAGLAVWGAIRSSDGRPLLPLRWTKGAFETPPLYEKWNAFSRIRIDGRPDVPESPFGWGLSPTYYAQAKPVRQVLLNIDASAATPLTAWDGDLTKLEHLKHDVTNMAHHLRQAADVLVVGVGGGRDVLSALAFEQRSVTGVELNQDILKAVTGPFGNFTGHLDRHPKVTLISDEARSYVARVRRNFDIIQVSLVDTWAASAAGAFVLSESALYTIEAWQSFMGRLKPDGILTYSRWYDRNRPAEMYRLTALARQALDRLGVVAPRRHILLVRLMARPGAGDHPDGLGTILVGRRPFSAAEISDLRRKAETLGFEIALDPEQTLDPVFDAITAQSGSEAFLRQYPLDIAAPTDDRPFFFHMLRLRTVFDERLWTAGAARINLDAVSALVGLLVLVIFLTTATILLPLRWRAGRPAPGSTPLLMFFTAIGLGFMLVEIAQMQRFNLFLGHPTYALSTVLLTLLLSSGIGSYLTESRLADRIQRRTWLAFLLVFVVLGGILTPPLLAATQASATPVRIALTMAVLFPMGLFMGTAFPLGMEWAAARAPALRPWLWGMNGAASVLATVLAVAISMTFGISTSFWAGTACYGVAFIVFIRSRKRPHQGQLDVLE